MVVSAAGSQLPEGDLMLLPACVSLLLVDEEAAAVNAGRPMIVPRFTAETALLWGKFILIQVILPSLPIERRY